LDSSKEPSSAGPWQQKVGQIKSGENKTLLRLTSSLQLVDLLKYL